MMTNKLAAIIHNLMEAKERIETAAPANPDMKNLERENWYTVTQLETFSKNLLQNIELTLKNKQG